jgi:hypothetical protein
MILSTCDLLTDSRTDVIGLAGVECQATGLPLVV